MAPCTMCIPARSSSRAVPAISGCSSGRACQNYGCVGYGDVGVSNRIGGAAMTTALIDESPAQSSGPKPLTEGKQGTGVLIGLWIFVAVPFLALIAAVPVAWGGWLGWSDIAIAAVMYVVTGL